jgi:hypothetical protein
MILASNADLVSALRDHEGQHAVNALDLDIIGIYGGSDLEPVFET